MVNGKVGVDVGSFARLLFIFSDLHNDGSGAIVVFNGYLKITTERVNV